MAILDPSKLQRPIVTGTALPPQQSGQVSTGKAQQNPFLNVLRQQLEAGSQTNFSKHAVSRVAERQIDVSSQNLQRLNEGMQLAQQKGLREALILIDSDAYIVSVNSQKVITVDDKAEKGSVYTNIDGTVIA